MTKGLDKDEQKEWIFKRLENIKDKNEELLNAFSAANKVSKTAKNVSDINYDSKFAFSLGSKYDGINDFYPLLNAFINTDEATNTKTKNCKNRILNNVNQLYNDYFNLYKISYNSANVRNDEKQRPVPT